nr:MAG TPA: hypothetical protein [Caudoviricetes sp.]
MDSMTCFFYTKRSHLPLTLTNSFHKPYVLLFLE